MRWSFYCTCHEAWKKEELPVSDRAWCADPGRADHRFIKEKTGCCFIVSSGLSFGEDHRIRRSGKGEDVSEAYAMVQYLREHEVKDEQIMLEDQSRTTRENLRFSKAYLEELKTPVGIVTNNFHLFRALLIGRSEGYENLTGIAAGCNRILF